MATKPKRDEDLAMFVVHIGMSPADYWQLTINQRNEIIKAYNKANKKR
jgi:hypothetical protein